ncbi:MmgE/PrpD family protein [Pelagibacterium sp.]|uniref:MmgE/PrpD family protein n=1 Tax=Pelagibacterium sp. TaxID=1967288 RepID=UPI003BA92536
MSFTPAIVDSYWTIREVPAHSLAAANVALADALAVMVAAAQDGLVRPFIDHALALGAGGRSTIIGQQSKAHAPMAALANGAMAHALDFEDTFEAGMIHPNASLVPAILALAESERVDGKKVLSALAVGCDFACRLSQALDSDPGRRGWYYPPVLSGLGATLGVSHLLGLSVARSVDALGLFASQFMLGDELKRSPHSHLRAVREGLAARAAVEATLLAQRGVRAVEEPLDGESGVFRLLTGAAPRSEIFEAVGRDFLGSEVSIKRWPSCRGTHPAIVLAERLRGRGIGKDHVASVRVRATPPNDMLFVPRASKIAPQTAIDAKFSIPFVFAAAMDAGTVALGAFSTAQLQRPDLLALAAKVKMAELVDTTAFEADFVVELKDGRSIAECVERVPEWRTGGLALGDLRSKIAGCLAHGGSSWEVDGFLGAIGQVETAGIGPVMALL